MKTYSHPHYRQSHAWKRFASILSGVRDYAYERKEAALKWSLGRGTKGFAIPAELQLEPKDGRGLGALTRRIKRGRTYPELALRRRYHERRDAVEIEAVIHERTRTRVEAVRIGLLPEEDAAWVRPLLRHHLPLKTFIANVKQAGGKSYHTGLSVTIAISRPDEAARAWIDCYDDRKQKAKGLPGSSRRRTGIPAYISGGGRSGGYPGTDYNRKIADTRDEISRLQLKAAKLEARRVSCAHVGRKIRKLQARVKRFQKKATQSACWKAREPTAEEWLRENLSARETCMTDLPARDHWNAARRI